MQENTFIDTRGIWK